MNIKYTGWRRAIPLATLAVFASACVEKKPDTTAQDSTLSRDIALANQDTAVQPQLRDGAATPVAPAAAPTTTAPAPTRVTPRSVPAPAAAPTRTTTHTTTRTTTTTPAPTMAPAVAPATTASGNTVTPGTGRREAALGTIASGTTLSLTSNARVCTNTNKVGDRISATVREPVTGSNGAVIPAGATVSLVITNLKRSENVNDKIQMDFRVASVSFGGHTYPVSATVQSAQVDRVRNESQGKDVQKVATGAAVGAVIGQILGHNTKSTVIGGAVGAAAGAGAAATTANYEGCVPDGGRISIALSSPLQVQSSTAE